MKNVALLGIAAFMQIPLYKPPIVELKPPQIEIVQFEKLESKPLLELPRRTQSAQKPSLAGSGNLHDWLLKLRMCESGGNYQANTGNGYYGGYQFLISTWDRVAPKLGRPDLVGVRPDRARPADQDFMVVGNTKLSSGGLATQHPGCYKKLGLSQFPPE